MRILHYALGFPPYRSGGLTKFCMDLLCQQNRDGHQVAMMWPGQMGFVKKSVCVKNRGMVNIGDVSITSYEVINPLPISYDEGIADIQHFIKNVDKGTFRNILSEFKPDTVHVHTLMGLYKGFLEAVKEYGARLVFTAHDFFPICPKVTMFRSGEICQSVQSCGECGVCNTTALSMKKIMILQSPLYRELKNSVVVKKLRKQHRDAYLSESTADLNTTPVGTPKDYKALREHYYSMLQMLDLIHYNSNVTKTIYEEFFELPRNCVTSITHSDISDQKVTKVFKVDLLRIRYLGPAGVAKGFFC